MKLLCIMLLSGTALAQKFDAASVKPFDPAKARAEAKRRIFTLTPGGVTAYGVTLKEVIAAAYGVKDYQIAGPSWLTSEGFEIIAKTAAPATDDQLRVMLQDLLADRFRLVSHREQRELPVYALLAGKKTSALQEAKADAEAKLTFQNGGFRFQNYSMGRFAEYLTRMRGINRPVLDLTGMEGIYNFAIVFADSADPAEVKMAVERALTDDSILAVVGSQLGLKIESRKMPQDMLIIDGIERPTAN